MKKYSALILLFYICLAFGETRQNEKIWTGAVIIGSLSADNKIKYYIQPQIGLIDDKYKFENSFLFLGIGYRPKLEFTFWFLNGYNVTRRLNGNIRHLDTLRQQFNWLVINNDYIDFSSISRLEERKNIADSQLSIRLREMLTTRLPFREWKNHSLVLSNEIFFNINHPAWNNSDTFVDQNRVFIGIGTQFSKYAILDVGYMNQYLFKQRDANKNVLYIYLNIFT